MGASLIRRGCAQSASSGKENGGLLLRPVGSEPAGGSVQGASQPAAPLTAPLLSPGHPHPAPEGTYSSRQHDQQRHHLLLHHGERPQRRQERCWAERAAPPPASRLRWLWFLLGSQALGFPYLSASPITRVNCKKHPRPQAACGAACDGWSFSVIPTALPLSLALPPSLAPPSLSGPASPWPCLPLELGRSVLWPVLSAVPSALEILEKPRTLTLSSVP